ncbi:MAG: hypothetical protein EOO92_02405 [Pedobacter sp.]|nr:MAG: hypothetical protein EOO92_02405 [Pedobacter sp.]
MKNVLLKKFFFKPGFKVLIGIVPENGAAVLGDIDEIELVTDANQTFDALLLFVKNSLELSDALKEWAAKITSDKIVWIAYPKKTSGIPTDLKMAKWDELQEYQLTPCGSVAVDDTWTALRIKPIGDVKSSGVGNAQIKTNEFAEFIDVENKKVTPPADLAKLLLQHPEAGAFFNSLAYSHKKEYVLWILTAKQAATRTARLEKALQMLLTDKKNPTAK